MATTINADLQNLRQLNNDVISSKQGIETTAKNINEAFDELKTVIKGDSVYQAMDRITAKTSEVQVKMAKAFEDLTTFLNNQISQYTVAGENANASLGDALAFIESTL